MKSVLLMVLLALSAATAHAAERQVTLAVDGMDCGACPITVRKALERLDGVQVTGVDIAAGTMQVRVTDDAVDDARLQQATADAGYPSEVVRPSSEPAAEPRADTAPDLPALSADLEPLRSAFNAANGQHRILAVVSPTCGACRLGVQALQASVLSNPDPQLRLFVVWSPMLRRDNAQTAREAAAAIDDPRARQYQDLSRHAGTALRRDLFPDARAEMLEALPPDHYFREYAQASQADKPEWDIYLSFPPEVVWGERVPRPEHWIRQTALFPDDQEQLISLMWLDDYASMPVEGDLIATMSRLLP